jgi:hypothetical protein
MRVELKKKLDRIVVSKRPIAELPKDPGLRRAIWTEPKLVGEGRIHGVDGRGRHPPPLSSRACAKTKKRRTVVRENPPKVTIRVNPWLKRGSVSLISGMRSFSKFTFARLNCSLIVSPPNRSNVLRWRPVDQRRQFRIKLIQGATRDERGWRERGSIRRVRRGCGVKIETDLMTSRRKTTFF